MGVKSIIISSLLLFGFLLGTPYIFGNAVEWGYANYLYSLNIEYYDDPVIAGRTATMTVKVGANTDVVLHVEFKGEFSWGHWIFDSKEIPFEAGSSIATVDIEIPIKTLIEPASEFYYYVYMTLPGDGWSSDVWSLKKSVNVSPPPDVDLKDLDGLLGHLKWSVYSSHLPEGIKTSLIMKLESAWNLIYFAFEYGVTDKINGAIGSMNAFSNELDSSNLESFHNYDIWKEQVDRIIKLLDSSV